MPLIENVDYAPSGMYRSAHFNTIMTAMLRKVDTPNMERQRITLKDGDFIDLDTSLQGRKTVAVIVHGLEGDGYRPYMLGMAQALQQVGLDTINVNLRGCSGEVNRLLTTYHSGSTDDLSEILDYVFNQYEYQQLVLVGFSLGGNIVLKYTGDQAGELDSRIKASIGVSVPCDLTSCANSIKETRNFIYMRRFIHNLRAKVKAKKHLLPPDMDYNQLLSAKNFHEFDHWFTAKVHGFKSAEHYWETCSSKPGLDQVVIPTLLLNARDDSFLGDECYPEDIARSHALFYMMAPKYGGHVGFSGDNRDGMLWSEYQVTNFVKEHVLT